MNTILALGLALGLVMAPVFVNAEETAAVEVGNKICPVSHEKIGTEGMESHKITYNGKMYNLCCSMCEKDFNKDPEKYTKLIDEEMKALTQTQ